MTRSSTVATVALAVLIAVGAANWISAEQPLHRVLTADSRNNGISIHSYHRWLIDPGTLVLDIWSVSDERSMIDVTRVLLRAAETQRDRRLDRVMLAYRGQARLMMDGDTFTNIGRQMSQGQNPIYLMRTLPQNVLNIDGRPAYDTWAGSGLAVLGQQMENINQFHHDWWLDAELHRQR